MRRNLLAWIPVAGVLIQLAICTAAIAANVKTSTTTKYRITGVVKDALGRPIKQAALSLQTTGGQVVAHATSNDAGEFSFNASARHLCNRGDQPWVQDGDRDRDGLSERRGAGSSRDGSREGSQPGGRGDAAEPDRATALSPQHRRQQIYVHPAGDPGTAAGREYTL